MKLPPTLIPGLKAWVHRNAKQLTPLEVASLGNNVIFDNHKVMKILIENGAELGLKDEREKLFKDYLEDHPCQASAFTGDSIPDELEDDLTFPKFKCPLSLGLILDPVLDPTDGRTLYERSMILKSLKIDQKSPTTKKNLSPNQFLEVPLIAKYIRSRVAKYHAEKKKGLPESSS